MSRTTRAHCACSLAALGTALSPLSVAMAYVPIDDLGTGLYLNQYQGGLYPGGSNAMPADHFSAGLARSASIGPLDVAGQPNPNGKYVMLSIGMSNTAQEWSGNNPGFTHQSYSLMGQAAAHPAVNHSTMVLMNGARGGQTASTWDDPGEVNYLNIATLLTQNSMSELQVRAAWLKVANAQPQISLPAANADANVLVTQMGNIVRSMKTRYPNLETVFVSSRIYAGYATTQLNPEPYAYESGFAVKRLVEAQINQMNGGTIDPLAGNLSYGTGGPAPYVAWGPYLWADGANPRASDGLTWLPTDFNTDGTHPNIDGRRKVGSMLMRGFINSPLTRDWFLRYRQGDANTDGVIDFDDYVRIDAGFNNGLSGWANGDFDYNGIVDFDDYVLIDMNFNARAGSMGRAARFLSGEDRGVSDMQTPALRKVVDHFAQFGVEYASQFLSSIPEPGLAGATAAHALLLRRRRNRA